MPPLEEYVDHADELVEEVYKGFGAVVGVAPMTSEFSALVGKAHTYRILSRVVDNYREHNMLTEQVAAEAKAARQQFAEAYKILWEKHQMS